MKRHKRSKRSLLDSEFARPVCALVLLGLLYLAFEVGLLGWFAGIPFGILADGLVSGR